MIPIKLSIQGLYSYQELQEIDFQRLTSSSVFGIFGKVGSGKTSLLEAISFALYGKTERLNDQDKRAYNMMNLKSKHLRIDFEFQAGPDQNLYRFIYESKRHPKKHHEISPGERRMFIWQENDWHPIGSEKEDISVLSKQILGLDYDNFKRTIIIPQNQFREFLELSPTERTRMMNQLFKLDQYDLAARVGKLSKVNDDQLSELRGRLAPLENVTPEAIQQAKADLQAIQQNLDETSGKIAQLEPTEQQLLYLQKQHTSLIWARDELAQWLLQEPAFQQIKRTIEQYERCRLVFQQDFATLEKLQHRRNELLRSAQDTQQRFTTLTDTIPALLTAYNSARVAYENRGIFQKQLDELDTVQTIRTIQESIEQLTRNQLALEQQNRQKKDQIDQRKEERKNYLSIIDTLTRQESNLERLYKVQNWFSAYKPLKKQADGLQEQLDQHDKKVAELKRRKDESLTSFPPEWSEFTLKTLPVQIDQAIEQLKTIQDQRQAVHQEALLKHELQRYAQNLIDGTPCPLCGSTHHPAIHSDVTNEVDVTKTEEQLKKVRQRIDDTTTLRLTIKGLEAELRTVLDNGKQLTNERSNVVQQLTTHEDMFIWPEFSIDDEQSVSTAIQRESHTQKQLQDAQNSVREINNRIEEAEAAFNLATVTLTKANTDVIELTTQLNVLAASLKHYKLSDVASWHLGQIDEARDELSHRFDQAKTDFDTAEKQRNEAEKEQATLQEQIQQLQKQVDEVVDDIGTIENTIAQHLTENELTREEVEQLLRSNLNIDLEKERINEYDDKLRSFRNLVADLDAELASQPFDADTLAAVQDQLQTLRTQKDAFYTELGKAGNIVTTLEKQYVTKQAHQKRYDELDLRRQDLKKMDELFRAQGFVNYVSAVYLKNLSESANDRFFKLTNNQLKLELDEKNNFQVRDYLNGGEVRSVKTLSGGQTFQAALSLALALSDNIQHLTKAKQNLFFLDEGFGTLDKDSLQTVFKTLKALRSENRVVGIISHVDELQQEVDMYIRTLASEKGSRIIGSWEE